MNRLQSETSLYLRQHATNPVDWYPWGPEALETAKRLDRPIFLSIGYSACHWCHVMEHESFEDEATAKFLNDHFVSIKVDREERPDIDNIYMTSLQVMTREGGGWPLSVWLTPDLHPFYAGTYFPPDDRYAPHRPSFLGLLNGIVDAWKNRRDEIKDRSGEIVQFLAEAESVSKEGELTPALLSQAASAIQRNFDPTHGGFGREPKFPHALELRLLLRLAKRLKNDSALHMVRLSLDKMAMGGIYDQIGGGFHRYSVDRVWLVPHFEKMLYDNALLASAYVEAWQATKEPFYREVATETLEYVMREMTSPHGAFYSTLDADSEGEEGKFYVWSLKEIESLLGADEAALFAYVYGVTPEGNFEGHNILNRSKNWEQLARMQQTPEAELRKRIKESAGKLYDERAERVWPGRDEKILTSWNGLMIAAFAQAGAAFGDSRFLTAARRAAEFVLTKMRSADGSLFRTAGDESPAKLQAYSEDYAFFIDALVELYQATFEVRWLESALDLSERLRNQFGDPKGGFFFTGANHETLIVRNKDSYDGSTPSGNSMAATALLKLGALTGRQDLTREAVKTLRAFREFMAESPSGAGQMLGALDFHFGPVQEYVLVGSRQDSEVGEALKLLRERFDPHAVVAFHDPNAGEAPTKLLPLLEGREMIDGKVTLYVCENYSCKAPLVGLGAIRSGVGDR
jgi:uncharacterized protein